MASDSEPIAAKIPRRLDDDAELVLRIRSGSEDAFIILIERYHIPMLTLAAVFLSRAEAEDIVQATWQGVLNAIRGDVARGSFRIWVFRLLMNRIRTRMRSEGRSFPISTQWDPALEPPELSVDPDRFLDATHPRWPHCWRTPPQNWGASPENRLITREAQAYIGRAIDSLPPSRRAVIVLRDMAGCTMDEATEILSLSDSDLRLLLHGARSTLHRALERYFEAR